MKKLLIGCGSIFAAFLLLTACSSGGNTAEESPKADTPTPAEKPVEKSDKPTSDDSGKIFTGTAQESGNSEKFEIKHGNEVKLDWNGSAGDLEDFALFSVILKNSDGREVAVVLAEMGETKGSHTFRDIPPGTYFLEWNTANFKPTVTIEDK